MVIFLTTKQYQICQNVELAFDFVADKKVPWQLVHLTEGQEPYVSFKGAQKRQ